MLLAHMFNFFEIYIEVKPLLLMPVNATYEAACKNVQIDALVHSKLFEIFVSN